LEAADILLVVGSADVVGVTRLVRGLHELGELADRRPAAVPDQRRVVLNRVPASARRSRGLVRMLAGADPDSPMGSAFLVPDDAEASARSVAVGRTLAEVAPRSPTRAALVELARSVRPSGVARAGRSAGNALRRGRGARTLRAHRARSKDSTGGGSS